MNDSRDSRRTLAQRHRQLPLAVRREILLTRAALERLEFAQAVSAAREAARPARWLASTLQRVTQPRSWLDWLGGDSSYPHLKTALSIGLAVLGRSTLRRGLGKLLRVSAFAGLAALASVALHKSRRKAPDQP